MLNIECKNPAYRKELVAFLVLRRLLIARLAKFDAAGILSAAEGVSRPSGLSQSGDFFNWALRIERSMGGKMPFDEYDFVFAAAVLRKYVKDKGLAQKKERVISEIINMAKDFEFREEGVEEEELEELTSDLFGCNAE